MRFSWAKLALGAVLVAVVIAPMTSAVAQQAPEQVRVSLRLKDADMLTATQTLTHMSGLMFVVEPSDVPFGKITLELPNVTAEDAVKYICQAAGAYFRRDENGVYIIGHTKPIADTTNGTAQPAGKPVLMRKRIRLMKADAEEVAIKLKGGIPDPNLLFERLHRFEQLNRSNSNALNFTPMPNLGTVFAVGQPQTGQQFSNANREAGNGIDLPGEGAGQIGGGRGGGGGGLAGGGGGQGGGFQGGGQGGQNNGNVNAQLQGGQGLVPPGITFVSYDPTDNSFIVEGTDEAIAEFTKLINEFDVAPRQVQIKVEFITTSNSVSRSLGFEFLYQRGTVQAGTRPGTFVRAGDPVFLNYGIGNITARMRTQLLEGFGKVVNAPIIRTLNNQPATIQSSVQTVIFVNQVATGAGGAIVVVPNPVSLNINTGLSVAPRINGDNTITLALSPQIQDFGQLRRGPNGEEIPDVLSQQINVVARVRNDETIVLGGLTRKSDQGSEARVPILADLPIIGQFFRSTTRDKNNSELLIFVTPHIIEDEESGAINP